MIALLALGAFILSYVQDIQVIVTRRKGIARAGQLVAAFVTHRWFLLTVLVVAVLSLIGIYVQGERRWRQSGGLRSAGELQAQVIHGPAAWPPPQPVPPEEEPEERPAVLFDMKCLNASCGWRGRRISRRRQHGDGVPMSPGESVTADACPDCGGRDMQGVPVADLMNWEAGALPGHEGPLPSPWVVLYVQSADGSKLRVHKCVVKGEFGVAIKDRGDTVFYGDRISALEQIQPDHLHTAHFPSPNEFKDAPAWPLSSGLYSVAWYAFDPQVGPGEFVVKEHEFEIRGVELVTP